MCAGEAFAHRTALSLGGDHLGAVAHWLALQIFAQSHAALAHAHAAGLRLPDVVVAVDGTVHRAVGRQGPRVNCSWGGRFQQFSPPCQLLLFWLINSYCYAKLLFFPSMLITSPIKVNKTN